MKIFKWAFLGLILLSLSFGGLMFWKAFKSKTFQPEVGIVDGQLRSCGPKPNCISSFADPESSFYIAPIESNTIETLWDDLNILLSDLKMEIVSSTETYIHAVDKTPLLKFVDDIEFLLDREGGRIHMRSASRVGYSDMGKNKKRLLKIKQALVGKL